MVCYINTAVFLLFFTLHVVEAAGIGAAMGCFCHLYSQLMFVMIYRKHCTWIVAGNDVGASN